MKPLLIIKTGSTLPEVAATRGDFEQWFEQLCDLPAGRVALVVDVEHGESLPLPATVAGAIVTGSAAMVSERRPWSEETARWLARAAGEDLPLLGVCYGHQLLAHALGGEVAANPRGREIGTVEVELAAAAAGDPLLGAYSSPLVVQATHLEAVLELPPGAVLLGGSRLDPHQAFRAGARAWGVQFHPEFDADVMRVYFDVRREELLAEGLDPTALRRELRDSDHGARLLRAFASLAGMRPGRRA